MDSSVGITSEVGVMKIAFFVNAFPMMSEAFIANSAAALIDAGHEVDIFGMANVNATGLSVPEVADRNLETRTRNIRWPTPWWQRAIQIPKIAHQIANKHGVRSLLRLNPMIYRRSLKNLISPYQVAGLPVDGTYDILHCQFAPLAEDVIKHRRAGFLTGKLVVNFRGYDITEVVQACGPNVYDSIWPEADGYLANCEHFRDKAISIGCPQDKITVVGSGIRLENFLFEPKSTPPGDTVRFLMIGRLIERKGFHVALRALAQFQAESNRRIEVDIVGDGVQREELGTLAEDLGIAEQVTFHGSRTHTEIAEYLARTDVMIAPSITCPKGGQDAPVNTIKEAMATGRPVVATRHGGIPELVEEGQTGTLAEENDSESLAAAIHRMMNMQTRWPTLLNNARKAVVDRYALPKTNNDLLSVYSNLIATSTDAPRPLNNSTTKAA